MSTRVSNENYEVVIGSDMDDHGRKCYEIRNKLYGVTEMYTRSLTFANIYASSANRMVMSKVWESDSLEELTALGGMANASKKAN